MDETDGKRTRTVDDIAEIFTAVDRILFLDCMAHKLSEKLEKAWLLSSVSTLETAMDKLDVREEIRPYYKRAFAWRQQKGHFSFDLLMEQVFAAMCGERAEPEIRDFIEHTYEGRYLNNSILGFCSGCCEVILRSVTELGTNEKLPVKLVMYILSEPDRLIPFFSALGELHLDSPEENTYEAIADKVVDLAFAPRDEDDAWLDVPQLDRETGKWTVICNGEKTKGTALETACAFAETELSYPYRTAPSSDELQTAGTFEEVLLALYKNPFKFSICGLEDHYAPRERELLNKVREKMMEHDPNWRRFR